MFLTWESTDPFPDERKWWSGQSLDMSNWVNRSWFSFEVERVKSSFLWISSMFKFVSLKFCNLAICDISVDWLQFCSTSFSWSKAISSPPSNDCRAVPDRIVDRTDPNNVMKMFEKNWMAAREKKQVVSLLKFFPAPSQFGISWAQRRYSQFSLKWIRNRLKRINRSSKIIK